MEPHILELEHYYLEIEIMKINFSANKLTNKDNIIIFLEKNFNFNFIEMEKPYEFNDLKLIILQKDISKNNLTKILENPNNQNSQVFAHKSLQDKIPSIYNVIFYPTNISTFQILTKKYQETNISYKDIHLSQDSFLINSNNQKKYMLQKKNLR